MTDSWANNGQKSACGVEQSMAWIGESLDRAFSSWPADVPLPDSLLDQAAAYERLSGAAFQDPAWGMRMPVWPEDPRSSQGIADLEAAFGTTSPGWDTPMPIWPEDAPPPASLKDLALISAGSSVPGSYGVSAQQVSVSSDTTTKPAWSPDALYVTMSDRSSMIRNPSDNREAGRWIIDHSWHNAIVYPVYDHKGRVVKYLEVNFAAKNWSDPSLLHNMATALDAVVSEVSGAIIVHECAAPPEGDPTVRTTVGADRYLDNLVKSMQSDAGEYRLGHNCRSWTEVATHYGIEPDKYDQWARHDRELADTYDRWADYDECTGNSAQADYNRQQAQHYRAQAEYNECQSQKALYEESRRAFGDHGFWWPWW